MNTPVDTYVDRDELLRQIGRGNIAAISGGRVTPILVAAELPVSSGYRVRVTLRLDDTYTIDREFPHGARENVYFDEVGELAYRASCFRSYDDDEWQVAA